MELANTGSDTITPHAHTQLAKRLGTPVRYYHRMLSQAPELLCINLNHWLHQGDGTQRIVRTLDQSIRGVLSSNYRALDHFDFAEVALQTFYGIGDVEVQA